MELGAEIEALKARLEALGGSASTSGMLTDHEIRIAKLEADLGGIATVLEKLVAKFESRSPPVVPSAA